MKRLTDPDFIYRDSAHTDVAATFKRLRREAKALEEQRARDELEAQRKTIILPAGMKKSA